MIVTRILDWRKYRNDYPNGGSCPTRTWLEYILDNELDLHSSIRKWFPKKNDNNEIREGRNDFREVLLRAVKTLAVSQKRKVPGKKVELE